MRSCCYCPNCEEGYVAVKDRGKAAVLGDTGGELKTPIGKASLCSKCNAAIIVSDDLKDKLRVAGEGLQKADNMQSTGKQPLRRACCTAHRLQILNRLSD